jgi:hypothetical protein
MRVDKLRLGLKLRFGNRTSSPPWGGVTVEEFGMLAVNLIYLKSREWYSKRGWP